MHVARQSGSRSGPRPATPPAAGDPCVRQTTIASSEGVPLPPRASRTRDPGRLHSPELVVERTNQREACVPRAMLSARATFLPWSLPGSLPGSLPWASTHTTCPSSNATTATGFDACTPQRGASPASSPTKPLPKRSAAHTTPRGPPPRSHPEPSQQHASRARPRLRNSPRRRVHLRPDLILRASTLPGRSRAHLVSCPPGSPRAARALAHDPLARPPPHEPVALVAKPCREP